MLMPDKDGFYKCSECEFESENVFKLLEHCMIDFKFKLKLSRAYVLDLFALLKGIDSALEMGELDELNQLTQMATLTLINASEGKDEFDKFMGETFIKEEAEALISELEGMLREENNG